MPKPCGSSGAMQRDANARAARFAYFPARWPLGLSVVARMALYRRCVRHPPSHRAYSGLGLSLIISLGLCTMRVSLRTLTSCRSHSSRVSFCTPFRLYVSLFSRRAMHRYNSRQNDTDQPHIVRCCRHLVITNSSAIAEKARVTNLLSASLADRHTAG